LQFDVIEDLLDYVWVSRTDSAKESRAKLKINSLSGYSEGSSLVKTEGNGGPFESINYVQAPMFKYLRLYLFYMPVNTCVQTGNHALLKL
jgi:hypothetical protein